MKIYGIIFVLKTHQVKVVQVEAVNKCVALVRALLEQERDEVEEILDIQIREL